MQRTNGKGKKEPVKNSCINNYFLFLQGGVFTIFLIYVKITHYYHATKM
jgi:hypothetical protein